jgi:hypothetical protein
MALLCYASQAIPSTTEQSPLYINMTPYASGNESAVAIGYSDQSRFDKFESTYLNIKLNHFSIYQSVISLQSPNVPTIIDNVYPSLIVNLSQTIGSYTFGIHYPIAAIDISTTNSLIGTILVTNKDNV